MNMFYMDFDSKTCKFSKPYGGAVIDYSAVAGLWNPCAGSITPWKTHLSSEEYEPNARYYAPGNTLPGLFVAKEAENALAMATYFNVYPESINSIDDLLKVFNPYNVRSKLVYLNIYLNQFNQMNCIIFVYVVWLRK